MQAGFARFFTRQPPTPLPRSLEIAWTLCLTIDAWLTASAEHVVAVHCLAGKGRTGVIVCCFLLFSGFFFGNNNGAADDGDEEFFNLEPPAALAATALAHFSRMRGDGITYASQARIVQYFARVIHAALIAESADSKTPGGAACLDLSVNARGTPGATGTTRVRRAAVRCVRRLRSLPLPQPAKILIVKICLFGLLPPPLAGARGDEGIEATPQPMVRVAGVAHQGLGPRGAPIYYDSAKQVHQKLDSDEGDASSPHAPVVAAADAGVVFLYHPHVRVAGDIAISVCAASGASIFRVALHTAFFVRGKAPYVRLTKVDVDQSKRMRREFPLGDNFACDIFFSEEGGGEGVSAASEPDAAQESAPTEASDAVGAAPPGAAQARTRDEEAILLADD